MIIMFRTNNTIVSYCIFLKIHQTESQMCIELDWEFAQRPQTWNLLVMR